MQQGYCFRVANELAAWLANTFPQLELEGEPPPPPAGYEEPAFEVIEAQLASRGLRLPAGALRRYHLSLKTRGFVVLSGVSGSGKTWLARLYAEAIEARPELVAVAPNWTTNEDLLGYLDPLEQKYRHTPFSLFLTEAASEYEAAMSAGVKPRPFPPHPRRDEPCPG